MQPHASTLHVLAMAAWLLAASFPSSAAAGILGVEAFDGPLPWYDSRNLTTRARTPADTAPEFELLLSRSRYWAEDGHLEVVALLQPPEELAATATALSVRFLDAAGNALYTADLDALPGPRVAFYPAIPEGFAGAARLEVTWRAGERKLAAATGAFRVERQAEPAPRSGRIAIQAPNPDGVRVGGLPISVGVPFPRGVLHNRAHLRLVDDRGAEIPAQFTETGRWSKYGTLKWVRCDFTSELNGAPRRFFIEYGPRVHRARGAGRRITVEECGGPASPRIEAGRLRLDDGLWFDAAGDGRYVKVLEAAALHGAFVEHENGRVYRLPAGDAFEIEESGAERVVLRRRGWYMEDAAHGVAATSLTPPLPHPHTHTLPHPHTHTLPHPHTHTLLHSPPPPASAFCQYEVRYVLHRDSPFLRVFFTWIFTGDSDMDRIRNMGWKLALPAAARPAGFLTAFGTNGAWVAGDHLLQYAHDEFEVAHDAIVPHSASVTAHPGGRAPGVARIVLEGAELYFGARDFWQAFPSELEFRDHALWFHNWPRHGKPRPEPLVDPARATLLDFAHSGQVLDLRLPDAYTVDPLDMSHCGPRETERIWARGQPETVNAQGLARTEEFWLYVAPPAETTENAARVMEGMNAETLRAVVDPAWVIASGVFFEAHPRDHEQFGLFETLYEATGPLLDLERIERVGLYGMWLHGEALWDWGGYGHLGNLYRQLRKGHGGYWRLCWLPYARSGDPRLLKHHDAALRRMIDANFCHYVSADVARKATGAGGVTRRPGFWKRGALPWGGWGDVVLLDYERQPHQWWSAWYMTGYRRARDMALRYRDLAKEYAVQASFRGGNRTIESVQKAFTDSYESTFDPWFLPWMHALARQHREAWPAGRWQPYGRYWMPGDREFHRFTGCPEHAAYFADLHPNHNYTWHITGDETVLRRRVAALMEMEETGTRMYGRQHRSSEWVMTLGAIARAERRPPPLHTPFPQRLRAHTDVGDEKVFRTPPVAFRKVADQALPLTLRLIRLQTYQKANDTRTWWIYGPDGREFMRGDLSIGTYENQPGIEVVLPADAPEGVYHLFCEMRSTDPESDRTSGYALRGLYYPITPPGTPEVILNPEERLGPAGFSVDTPGYYFYVPEEVEEFTIRDISSHTASAVRDPDGHFAWQHPERGTATATLSAAPEHRGRLWRIRGGTFTMDPQIPPYYAVDADRWFDYRPYTTPEYPEMESFNQPRKESVMLRIHRHRSARDGASK